MSARAAQAGRTPVQLAHRGVLLADPRDRVAGEHRRLGGRAPRRRRRRPGEHPRGLAGGPVGHVLAGRRDADVEPEHRRRDRPHGRGLRAAADEEQPLDRRRPGPAARRCRRRARTACPRPRRGPGARASCWPAAGRAGRRWRRACSACARPPGRARGRARRRPRGRTGPARTGRAWSTPSIRAAASSTRDAFSVQASGRKPPVASANPVTRPEPSAVAADAIAETTPGGADGDGDVAGQQAEREGRGGVVAGAGPEDRRRRWSGGPPRTGRARGGRSASCPRASSSRSCR